MSYAPKDLEAGVDTIRARAEALLLAFPNDAAGQRAKVEYVPADFGWR